MEKYKIDEIHCREYLVDGELKKWEGDTSEVFSTIDIKEKGEYSPTLLGSIPDMDSDSAIEALESAKKAFNRGQGKWPTMKVRDRLKCMKRFADKMQDHRDIVVKLLMWEIGKNKTWDTKTKIEEEINELLDTEKNYELENMFEPYEVMFNHLKDIKMFQGQFQNKHKELLETFDSKEAKISEFLVEQN